MLHVLVKLKVKNFSLLEEYEKQAIAIMKGYHGQLLSAFETHREPDGGGEEVHILTFPNQQAFINYQADTNLKLLADLRTQAICDTEVVLSSSIKSY